MLADLQTDRIGPYERRVIQSVAEAQPDVVLLAGDYLQVAPAQWDTLRAELNVVLREANLAAHARVFAIQGNIDSGSGWTDIFRSLDFAAVSVNESFDLRVAVTASALPPYDYSPGGNATKIGQLTQDQPKCLRASILGWQSASSDSNP